MLEKFRQIDGEVLTLEQYVDRFWKDAKADPDDFWKLERMQNFNELKNESWEAAAQGRFADSIKLAYDSFPAMTKEFEEEPFEVPHRLRILEEPPTVYVRWELMIYKQWAKLGEQISIAFPLLVSDYEVDEHLPEVVVLGDTATYEVLYDANGKLSGGRRITDKAVISQAKAEIKALFKQAEPLQLFIDKHPDWPLDANVSKQHSA